MKIIPLFLLCFFLLLLCSCGAGGEGYNSFDYELLGTWKAKKKTQTEDPEIYEYAQIEINYHSMKITGGNIAHFGNIPPDVELEGYSDYAEKLIYINARDKWQSPVAYRTWDTGASYPKTKMLTLEGGGFEDEDFELQLLAE